MSKFIVGTFLILGWAFYEMSDGSDFTPEQAAVASAEPEVVEDVNVIAVSDLAPALVSPAIEVEVTRADTSTLLDLSTGALTDPSRIDIAVAAPADTAVEAVLASVVTEAPTETEEITAPALDLRFVAGSRVNMRSGPGTDFAVLATLPGGTEAEVIEVDAEGWARIRITGSGAIGWMAERLLSES